MKYTAVLIMIIGVSGIMHGMNHSDDVVLLDPVTSDDSDNMSSTRESYKRRLEKIKKECGSIKFRSENSTGETEVFFKFAVVYPHKPTFIAPAKTTHQKRRGRRYKPYVKYGLAEIPCYWETQDTIDIIRPREFKQIANSCINDQRTALLITDDENSEPIAYYVTCNGIAKIPIPGVSPLSLIKVCEPHDMKISTYNDSQFIVGSFPYNAFLSRNEKGIKVTRNVFYTNIFGQRCNASTIRDLPQVYKHFIESTYYEESPKRSYEKSSRSDDIPITSCSDEYELKLKLPVKKWDWSSQVLSALGNYFTLYQRQKTWTEKLSHEQCASLIIALIYERETTAAASVLRDLLHNTWFFVPNNRFKQVNAINQERILVDDGKYEYGEYTLPLYGLWDPCYIFSFLPNIMHRDAVSFDDEKKMTPLKLLKIVQARADQYAKQSL